MRRSGHKLSDSRKAFRSNQMLLGFLLFCKRLSEGGGPLFDLLFELEVQQLQLLVAFCVLDGHRCLICHRRKQVQIFIHKELPGFFLADGNDSGQTFPCRYRNDHCYAQTVKKTDHAVPLPVVHRIPFRSRPGERLFLFFQYSDERGDFFGGRFFALIRFLTFVETINAGLGHHENHLFHLQGLRDRADQQVANLREFEKRREATADLLEKFPIVITPPEEEVIDETLHPLPQRIEQQNDDECQNQRKHERMASPCGHEKGVKEKDNENI